MTRILGATALTMALAACGSEEAVAPSGPAIPNAPDATKPAHLIALSTYDASVGTLIEVYGSNLPRPADAEAFIVFAGTFTGEDGRAEAVDLESPLRAMDPGTARWTAFGPYRNPLSAAGNKTGTFRGTIAARVLAADGTKLEDPSPTQVELTVKPSILVHELQPLAASCSGAVKRAIGGAAYRIRVEAIGFDPRSFTYSVSAPVASLAPVVVRHLATGKLDGVGERGDFHMPEVPEGMQSYSALVSIQAVDTAGKSHQTAFAIAVHRPLEVFYNGNLEVAEILAPVPVSGCIPGGEIGREVAYNEAMTETRSRSYDLSWNEQWLDTHTVSVGSETTVGLSEQNGIGFSSSDGESWNWSLGAEANGKLDLGGLVEVGISASQSRGGERSSSRTREQSRSTGLNASTTTTETESASQSQGGQIGGSFAWQLSSEETISKSFGGFILPKTYGVFYRQATRLVRKAAVVAYNQCGSATVVANVDFSDWTWAPDLAVATTCPPLPASNLPPAQCTLSPCAGQ